MNGQLKRFYGISFAIILFLLFSVTSFSQGSFDIENIDSGKKKTGTSLENTSEVRSSFASLDDSNTIIKKAEEYNKKGLTTLAIKEYERAVNIDGANVGLLFIYVDILLKSPNKSEVAIAKLNEYVKKYGPNNEVLERLRQLYETSGNIDQLIRTLKDCIEYAPNEDERKRYKTDYEDYSRIFSLKEELGLKPSDVTKRFELSKIYIKKKLYKDALLQLDYVIQLDRNFNDVYMVFGQAYTELGDYEKAKSSYEMYLLLKMYDKNATDTSAVANALSRIISVIDLNSRIKVNPKDAMAHYELGNLYWELGKSDFARSEIELAEFYEPRNIEIKMKLAELYRNMEILDREREKIIEIVKFETDAERRERALERLKELESKGITYRFASLKELEGWEVLQGIWDIEQGNLVCKSANATGILMVNGSYPDNVGIEFDFNMGSNVGVFINSNREVNVYTGYVFRLEKNAEKTLLRIYNFRSTRVIDEIDGVPLQEGGKNHLKIEKIGGVMFITLNGSEVLKTDKRGNLFGENDRLGFVMERDVSAKIDNVRIYVP